MGLYSSHLCIIDRFGTVTIITHEYVRRWEYLRTLNAANVMSTPTMSAALRVPENSSYRSLVIVDS